MSINSDDSLFAHRGIVAYIITLNLKGLGDSCDSSGANTHSKDTTGSFALITAYRDEV